MPRRGHGGIGRPGPVHLNFPLREPLAPVPEELDAADWAGRPDGRAWTDLRRSTAPPKPGMWRRRLRSAAAG